MKAILLLISSLFITLTAHAVEPVDPFKVCADLSAIGAASASVSCQQTVSRANYVSPYGAAVCQKIAHIGAASSSVTCMQNIVDKAFEESPAEVCSTIASIGAASAAAECALNGAGKTFRPGELQACLTLAQTGAASSSARCVGSSGYATPIPQPYEVCPSAASMMVKLKHAQAALMRNNSVRANRIIGELIYDLEPCAHQ